MQRRLMAGPDHQPDGVSDIEYRSVFMRTRVVAGARSAARTSSAVEGLRRGVAALDDLEPLRR
jgi:hypothetical protein